MEIPESVQSTKPTPKDRARNEIIRRFKRTAMQQAILAGLLLGFNIRAGGVLGGMLFILIFLAINGAMASFYYRKLRIRYEQEDAQRAASCK